MEHAIRIYKNNEDITGTPWAYSRLKPRLHGALLYKLHGRLDLDFFKVTNIVFNLRIFDTLFDAPFSSANNP